MSQCCHLCKYLIIKRYCKDITYDYTHKHTHTHTTPTGSHNVHTLIHTYILRYIYTQEHNFNFPKHHSFRAIWYTSCYVTNNTNNILINLTFVGPCSIVIYFYNKINQMHNILNLFYFGTTLYMFRTVFPSIIRSLRLYTYLMLYVQS